MMKLKQKKRKNQQLITSGSSAVHERTRSKKTGGIYGYVEILCGVILLLTGVGLFSQTWGLRLLDADVWIGRISRFYGGFLLAASIFLAVGVWTVQHSVRPSGKEDETDCPVCGKMNDSANKFCMFCGSRMEAPR